VATAAETTSSPRRHHWRRGLFIFALVIVVLVVVVRLILDPVAAHYTRRALNEMEGMRGDFADVHVTVFPPGYQIRKIKLFDTESKSREPLFYADRVWSQLDGRSLVHFRLDGKARIDGPKVVVVPGVTKEKKPPPPDLGTQVRKLMAMRVDRIEVRDGELVFAESAARDAPRMWVHDIEAVVENIATRRELTHGRPTTTTLSGVVQKTGRLTAFVSADPLAKGLTFAGRTSLEKLDLRDLYAFLAEKTQMQARKGELNLYAEFEARDGRISGGVKPVLKDVQLGPTDSKLVNRLKAWLADRAIDVASDRIPDRKAVATVVPLRGTISDPHVQVMPAVMGVIRNAFAAGLASGFTYLPPPVAEKPKGVIGQAVDALKKRPGPPAAEPERPASGRRAPRSAK
jgi:hypothetical protein